MSISNKAKYEELKATGLLPSPKGVALAVMQLAQDENTTNAAMARTIQADPALSGRLVRAANAARAARSLPIPSNSAGYRPATAKRSMTRPDSNSVANDGSRGAESDSAYRPGPVCAIGTV